LQEALAGFGKRIRPPGCDTSVWRVAFRNLGIARRQFTVGMLAGFVHQKSSRIHDCDRRSRIAGAHAARTYPHCAKSAEVAACHDLAGPTGAPAAIRPRGETSTDGPPACCAPRSIIYFGGTCERPAPVNIPPPKNCGFETPGHACVPWHDARFRHAPFISSWGLKKQFSR